MNIKFALEVFMQRFIYSARQYLKILNWGRWSRGMIPRLQRGDHEFESRPAH